MGTILIFKVIRVQSQSECALAAKPSRVRKNRFYSYATCGYFDKYYVEEVLKNDWKGAKIRIVNVDNTGGWKGSYCSIENEKLTGDPTVDKTAGTCHGPVQDFIRRVLHISGADEEEIATFTHESLFVNNQHLYLPPPVMNATVSKKNLIFDACVTAAAMGFVDICVGAHVTLVERTEKTHMHLLYSEPYYLVSKRKDDSMSLTDYMYRAFLPFHPTLWLMLIGCSVLFAVVLLWQEKSGFFADEGGEGEKNDGAIVEVKNSTPQRIENEEEIGKTNSIRKSNALLTTRENSTDLAKNTKTTSRENRTPLISNFCYSLYITLLSFVNNSLEITPSRPSSRVTGLGMAWLWLITITSYTAELTKMLTEKNTGNTAVVGSWNDVLTNPRIKVCFLHNLEDKVREDLKLHRTNQFVPKDSRSEVLNGVLNGECHAALASKEELEVDQSVDARLCSLTHVGEPLFYKDWSLPVSARASRALTVFTAIAKKKGAWERAQQDVK